jgi:hypothetical protein
VDVTEHAVPEPEEDTREVMTDGVVTWRWPPREMPEDFGIPENEYPLFPWREWFQRLLRRG